VSGHEPVQLALELEAAADSPPAPCRFCQGRGWVSRAPLGWASCTWCEGGVDPEPDAEELAGGEWFVVDTRVYLVTGSSEGTAIAAVAPDQAPVYHTTTAEPAEAQRPAARPALRVLA
jgi:hypothetical protein